MLRAPTGPTQPALAAADAGDQEAALAALQQALDSRHPGLIQVGVESRFADLRGNPRFEAIRRAVLGRANPLQQVASR